MDIVELMTYVAQPFIEVFYLIPYYVIAILLEILAHLVVFLKVFFNLIYYLFLGTIITIWETATETTQWTATEEINQAQTFLNTIPLFSTIFGVLIGLLFLGMAMRFYKMTHRSK